MTAKKVSCVGINMVSSRTLVGKISKPSVREIFQKMDKQGRTRLHDFQLPHNP
jgi:hypothetical protein